MEEQERIRFGDFPRTFWAANTMEIFERMAWYGFFAVSSLYITGSVESGGLGFSNQDRGVLQGVVTFFLYLFPVVSGALADRYGYKRMLFAAFVVLVPAYYLLGQFKTFPTFFLAFMLVALGASLFKPVIVGTVSKTSTQRTSSMAFGIFYMMVNIGGFLGPIVAGIVRGWDWKYVFIASSAWISLNFIVLALFYREPARQTEEQGKRSFGQVMRDMVEVLGNGRLFLFVFGLLAFLVIGSKYTSDGSFSWMHILLISAAWVVLNILFDIILKRKAGGAGGPWYLQPMRLGDWRFGLFLLIMSGFWTCFNQLFYTLPLYIQDYADTSGLLAGVSSLLEGLGAPQAAQALHEGMVKPGQINPEYMININAGAIILFQILVSYLVSRMKPFSTMFWGVVVTIFSFCLFVFGISGWVLVAGILVFSFGEMMASPKSKEYTGNIAPPDKVAMYMGYFYWCIALGNLFGGILSGQLYGYFGPEGISKPGWMWGFFAGLSLLTALAILLYDRGVVRKMKAQS